MTQEKQKLWTKYFILACMINLLTGFAMNMLNSSLAKYVYFLYGNASLSGIMNGVFAALPATVTQLLNCMAQAAINSFIVIYAESRGFSHIGLFFTCMAVAMAVTRLFAGRIVDRIGPVAGVAPGIGLSMIGFGLLLANCSNGLFFLAGFLIGFSMGVVNPVLQASAVQAAPEGRYGAANGTYQLSNDISNGVGAVLWGLVIDRWGYGAMFMGCLLFCGLSLLYLFTGFRRSLGKERT